MADSRDIAEQFERIINSPKQSWLLGAGVSYSANIPLMIPLTKRVLSECKSRVFPNDQEAIDLIDSIIDDIDELAHIEIFLTHLSDMISMSERSRQQTVAVGNKNVGRQKLIEVHNAILKQIAETVRWGYQASKLGEGGEILEPEKIGSPVSPIVDISQHIAFVRAVFGVGRAGLEIIRGPVEIYTLNYDTLVEDALSLCQVDFVDGFCGGGVAFWHPQSSFSSSRARARVTKLHGSVDWFRPTASPSPLLRVRYGDMYPGPGGAVMIFPQAAKYMNAQVDPFAELFSRFRVRLADSVDQTLLICGYSFSDDHVNADIEIAMSQPGSQLTLIAFTNEGEQGMPPKLASWRQHAAWRDRVYVASPKGLYRGASGPVFQTEGVDREWWTFSGATELFSRGLPRDIQEAIA